VSGDFYWMDTVNANGKTIIAAVDCTGHGVPGAFLTIVGNNLLNSIVIEQEITQPGEILTALNNGMIEWLHYGGKKEEIRDGMDISLCTIDNSNGAPTLRFAGAHNPLYKIRDNELIEIAANRFSIGGEIHESGKAFEDYDVEIKKGDIIYMFSDGYADQLGGKRGRKFMKGRFKELLLEIHKEPMKKQKEVLGKTLKKWRGDIFQVDDVLVMGIRF